MDVQPLCLLNSKLIKATTNTRKGGREGGRERERERDDDDEVPINLTI